jgi:hypothetical protein
VFERRFGFFFYCLSGQPADRLGRDKNNRGLTPLMEAYLVGYNDIHSMKELESGRLTPTSREKPKRRVLRFLKETPAIVGADMKTYGPFCPRMWLQYRLRTLKC